jgi:hypothetical protein
MDTCTNSPTAFEIDDEDTVEMTNIPIEESEFLTEETLAFILTEALQGYAESTEPDEDFGLLDARIADFASAGLLTKNGGIVLDLPNGAQFQIQIIQSRFPKKG